MLDNNWKKIKENLRKEITKLRAIEYLVDDLVQNSFQTDNDIIINLVKLRDLEGLKRLLKNHKSLEEMSLTALRVKARNLGVSYYTKLTRQTLINEIKELLKARERLIKTKGNINEQAYNFQDFDGIQFQPK